MFIYKEEKRFIRFIKKCLSSSNSIVNVISQIAICNPMSTAGKNYRSVLDANRDYNNNQTRGVPRIWEGGGPRIFFFRFGNLHVAKRHMLRMAKPCALLGGFGGMLPREIFLKRCNLVRFRVYFDQILSLFFF